MSDGRDEQIRASAARSAAEAFETLGSHAAQLSSHDGRIAAVEDRLRTYDSRAQQIQSQIARLATICEATEVHLGQVESHRESDHKELRLALINALRAGNTSSRVESVFGVLLSALALALMAYMLAAGKLG